MDDTSREVGLEGSHDNLGKEDTQAMGDSMMNAGGGIGSVSTEESAYHTVTKGVVSSSLDKMPLLGDTKGDFLAVGSARTEYSTLHSSTAGSPLHSYSTFFVVSIVTIGSVFGVCKFLKPSKLRTHHRRSL